VTGNNPEIAKVPRPGLLGTAPENGRMVQSSPFLGSQVSLALSGTNLKKPKPPSHKAMEGPFPSKTGNKKNEP